MRHCVIEAGRGALSALLLAVSATGCGSTEATVAAVVGGTVVATTVLAAASPGHEIEQIYYLGVLDPLEQVPPTIYRVTVRGQASLYSSMRFASGWVPAAVIDSLGARLQQGKDGKLTIEKAQDGTETEIGAFRGFVLSGPEGFREVPQGHRLVLVMGADPSAYFEAIDRVLGNVARAAKTERTAELEKQLLRKLLDVRYEDEALDAILRRAGDLNETAEQEKGGTG